ncbi:hypothetical protein ACN4EG_09085 [Alkalinema pantanalense CENA528]|uniref:hypothetical protein n=1 Tax=Alkalinema pantanalense TaxID=1620705 RepID=UPI003D6E03AF
MHQKQVVLGSVAIVLFGAAVSWGITSRANSQPNQEALCEMETASGQTVDLSKICGKSSSAAPRYKLDPNAPAQIIMIGKDKPSELWNTVPDLPTPPKMGKTYEQGKVSQPRMMPETPEVEGEDLEDLSE